ncbi:sigma-70 family RNA polymerase sigma factor [Blautia massiliensis (ex Durand et al. 2017)]|uniref:sigma-70 family RNA polymerase sigma factor n=1 Tax=Blautia massiliensis (ex Durand et al. 2017) TaxID=1737424 RepID=UPI00157027A0|nr:sigma-70 family RNA polymerase sigma factor [Blautia massiliensis (ex Durand et al. 2017)]
MTDEARKLVEENHNLIYSFLYKYHLDVEEWYDLAAIGLCKAANTYNNNKSGFSTYAYKCMYTTIIMEKRKENAMRIIPQNQIVYYENQVNESSKENDTSTFLNYIPSKQNIENETISTLSLENIENELAGNKRKVFLLLREGYAQCEISEIIGISKQRVSKIKQEIVEKYYIGGSCIE